MADDIYPFGFIDESHVIPDRQLHEFIPDTVADVVLPDVELVVPVVDAVLDFTRAAVCLHEQCPAFCPCIASYPSGHHV
ncbi:MAG TPA: hypothetical protein VGH54_21235 [Mycobacterium sp.]|jgi:hypothetical protein|uniref:hypothetical protein n=1 Tax=Mycobacterium sp. TaxID=1785 RepID=UPI002F42008B